MEDSDDEGFHQATLEFMTIKIKNMFNQTLPKNSQLKLSFKKTPLSVHYQLKMFEYPRQIDRFYQPKQQQPRHPEGEEALQIVRKVEGPSMLLSDFFPRKMICVYNRFHQNLLLKRDLTILIRNLSRQICNDQLTGFHQKTRPNHRHGLCFSADFEGGNLHSVYKSKKNGFYYLLVQNDVNTHGYNIWFHFNIRSAQQGKHQFVIVNMTKPIKYHQNICLLSYSSITRQYERKIGVNCIQSCFKNCESEKNYYSLHFQYEFTEGESVYFSLLPPYSFTKLMQLLGELQYPHRNTTIVVEAAGKSELGNTIPCLKIMNKVSPSKKVILVAARQHPCETVGSFVCEHIIKMLASESQIVLELLEKYTFVILPMINVDGVIHGNSRTNLLGYDLNRSWESSTAYKSLQCHFLWEYLWQVFESSEEIVWALDLHGHSKELGFMTYFSEQNQQTMILHHLLKAKSQLYAGQKSSFGLGAGKKESLRGQLYDRMKIGNSITIQTSYYGFSNEEGVFEHWQDQHFAQIAKNILELLLQTDVISKNKHKKQEMMQEIGRTSKTSVRASSSKHEKEGQQTIDSDSDPQDGYLRKQQRQEQHIKIARQKITKNFKAQNIRVETRGSFTRSALSKEWSESNIFIESKQSNIKSRQKIKITQKRRGSSKTEQYSIDSPNLSFVGSKKKLREIVVRQTKSKNTRRKVFSEHKYIINLQRSQNRQEDGEEPLKKTIQFKRSVKRVSENNRIKTQGQRLRESNERKESKSSKGEMVKLHTIEYPTSTYASYALNSQYRALRAKSRVLRDGASSRKILMNTFSESFHSRHQKLRQK